LDYGSTLEQWQRVLLCKVREKVVNRTIIRSRFCPPES
jgi:hypothetical protein